MQNLRQQSLGIMFGLLIGANLYAAQEHAEAWGLNLAHENSGFTQNKILQVYLITSSVPANILWPGDKPGFTFQFTNLKDQPVKAAGKVRIIQYEAVPYGGAWAEVHPRKIRDVATLPIAVDVPAKGWQDVAIQPDIPEQFGGYALIIDLEGQDSLFGATCIRTFKQTPQKRQFYRFTMDARDALDMLKRLGAAPNRTDTHYKVPTTDPGFENWYQGEAQYLRALQEIGLTICMEFAGDYWGRSIMPLNRPRAWLDDNDMMMPGQCDFVWLPSFDQDFKKVVKRFLVEFGWPKGPVNAIKLWNEPWNGSSISGWGADDERFREIYRDLGYARDEAEAEAGVKVLIGGCDSYANTCDKLFADGRPEFLKWFDFLSLHYQGINAYSTVKAWVDRKDKHGKPARVLIWDTESWVANTDAQIPGTLAALCSAGYDRLVGIGPGVVCLRQKREVKTAGGKETRNLVQTWAPGAAVGAFQHFVGERPFRELLFTNGLPYIMVFAAEPDSRGHADPEDGAVVVLGDPGPLFGDNSPVFRTCRSLEEVRSKKALREQLAALPPEAVERAGLEDQLAKLLPYAGATLTLQTDADRYGLYDIYGNPIAAQNGRIVIPLDARGFYLRGNGKSGSFNALLSALRAGRIEGLEPLAKACGDMLAPVTSKPSVRLKLTNVLNRPVRGALRVTLGKLTIEYPRDLEFQPHETRTVEVKVAGGEAVPSNLYPLSMVFDAGADGTAAHNENMRVNFIARRTIKVDGQLDDWKDVIPQAIRVEGPQTASLQEKAWWPYQKFDESFKKGLAIGYLAYDDANFYFGVRIADTTPDPGTLRFETNSGDDFYYPAVIYVPKTDMKNAVNFSARWTGTIAAHTNGEYKIYVKSAGGGARLWLDDNLAADDWQSHTSPNRVYAPTIICQAGQKIPFKLEYTHGVGKGEVTLAWQAPPEHGLAPIPADCLTAPNGQAGVKGEYYEGTNFDKLVQTRTDRIISFESWPGRPDEPEFGGTHREPLKWPEGVRRFTYRKGPLIPSGNSPNFDNVQIAFNVLPPDQKPLYPCPPGTMPQYIRYQCTDYEYALNKVAEACGGGTEIWRLRRPDMPFKHFFPRQAASPADGPVKRGRLAITHEGGTRVTECALPWNEIPDVKKRLDAGEPIKFSFRVNDNAGLGCMELSKGRSVARDNDSFRADWMEHWANELEFGFEK